MCKDEWIHRIPPPVLLGAVPWLYSFKEGFYPRVLLLKEVRPTDALRSGHIITRSSPLELSHSELPNDVFVYTFKITPWRSQGSEKCELKDESYLVKKLL